MRFSYIDSHGKEIEVDSVESLALRIELGAIKADSKMYDAVADRWAPAEEHPVYRSLARGERVDEDDIIAIGEEPVPAGDTEAPTTAGEAEEPATAGEGEGAPTTELDEVRPEEMDPEPPSEEVDEKPRSAEVDEEPSPSAEDGVAASLEGSEPENGEGDELGLGFSVAMSDEAEAVEELEIPPEPSAEQESRSGDMDDAFGEFGASGEADAGAPPEGPGASPAQSGAPSTPPGSAGAEGTGGLEPDDPSWVDEGEALWDPEGTGRGDPPAESGIRGIPEEDPLDPRNRLPEWAVRSDDDPPRVRKAAPADDVREPARVRGAPPRPAHWKRRRRGGKGGGRLLRLGLGVAAGLVVLLGVGYALLEPGGGRTGSEARGEAVGPPLSRELWGVMETAGERAYGDVLAEFREEIPRLDLPERPPQVWLEGVYLSSASDYTGVVRYWEGILRAVESVQEREDVLFRQHLNRRLSSTAGAAGGSTGTLAPEDVPRMEEVARSEFQATASARDSAYLAVLDVATASLELHAFLLDREEDIAYEPYSDPGVSRDPVLEAVPASPALREEMNTRLDRVIDAILSSEMPRPVTTAGLFDHLLTELSRIPVVTEFPAP